MSLRRLGMCFSLVCGLACSGPLESRLSAAPPAEKSKADKPAKKAAKSDAKSAADEKNADEPDAPEKDVAEKPSRKEVLKRARSGVVLVATFDALGEKAGFGSGCVIGPGLILTNYHVVASAVTAQVQPRGEGEERLGKALDVKGYRVLDEDNDLAILVVEGLPKSLHTLPVADPESIEQFDDVFAIGHPDGLKFTTSPGSVNATLKTTDLPEQFQPHMRSKETEFIQTDAVIAGGSSGGPLLNEAGEIVGINTFRLTNRIALAVGSKHVRDLRAKLDDHEKVSSLPVPNANVLVTKAVAALQRDYAREFEQFMTDAQRVRTNGAELQKLIRRNNPGPSFLEQCRDLVKKHPGEQEAADALRLSSTILSANDGRLSAGRQYLDALLKDAAQDPTLIPPSLLVLNALQGLPYSADLDRYLRGVIEQSADQNLQAAAGVVLISAMVAATTEQLGSEAAELAQQIYDRFGDERVQGTTVRETLQTIIDSRALAVGSVAPEIEGDDDQGKPMKLSDFRGKVVVLDFWADWCQHCRNLYPSERELVERMKDKPFALVGVNGDEEDRAKRVIANGIVTWRSWLDGSGGEISEKYKVEGWPTIYVLDQEGRIRYQGLRGKELDAAVDSLLGDGVKSESPQIVASGAEWKFQPASDAVDAAAWLKAEFDDAAWKAGAAPFGFGPVSAMTKLEPGEPGRRPATMLFRKTFDLPAGELPTKLLLKLRYADGVVVHLNSQEIYRDHLAADADWKSSAVVRAGDRETLGVSLLIDAADLQPSQNCLAVELHSFSPYRAEALFDLSLGHPPDVAALAAAADSEEKKAELSVLLAQIGVDLPGSREALEKFQADDSAAVRIRAAIAAAMFDLPVTMKELPETDDQRTLVTAMFFLNQLAWDAAARSDLDAGQYGLAYRRAKAACALYDKVLKEYQPRTDGVFNTLGVALYRSRRWDEAKSTFQQSFEKRGQNPLDAAFLSLTLHHLGDAAAAQDRRQQFAKLLQSDDWKHDAECQTVQREVDRVLGEKP